MSQSVLNGAAASGPVRVVSAAISGAVRREMLASHRNELYRLAETARRDRTPHRGQRRMAAVDIGDRGHDATLRNHFTQSLDPVETHAQWFLDQGVHTGVRQPRRQWHVQRRRRGNYRRVEAFERHGVKISEGRSRISLRHRATQFDIDLDEGDLGPAGGLETAQVAFADRAGADNQHAMDAGHGRSVPRVSRAKRQAEIPWWL